MEDNLWWKTTFSGRRSSVEGNIQWKTTFGERRPSVEDDLCWKTTFGGRRPSVEDDFWWKTTFDGKRPLVKDDLFMQRRLVQNSTFILKWGQGTCSLTKQTRRWTYSALRYLFPACCLVRFAAFSILKTVKEASAECRSFLDVVVIF